MSLPFELREIEEDFCILGDIDMFIAMLESGHMASAYNQMIKEGLAGLIKWEAICCGEV